MREQQRIEFIDLAKGICILLVVMGHLIPSFNKNFAFVFCFRMPLYFCLSGLFYKDYGGLKKLTIKKANKILIPFVAWYFISYAIYYGGRLITKSQIEEQYHLLDILTTNDIFNLPIWFLLCLFWSSILFTLIKKLAKTELHTGILVLIVAGLGWLMSTYKVFNFLYIGSALSCIPFFYMGYMLKKSTLLLTGVNTKKELSIMIICLLGATLIAFPPQNHQGFFITKMGYHMATPFRFILVQPCLL